MLILVVLGFALFEFCAGESLCLSLSWSHLFLLELVDLLLQLNKLLPALQEPLSVIVKVELADADTLVCDLLRSALVHLLVILLGSLVNRKLVISFEHELILDMAQLVVNLRFDLVTHQIICTF